MKFFKQVVAQNSQKFSNFKLNYFDKQMIFPWIIGAIVANDYLIEKPYTQFPV